MHWVTLEPLASYLHYIVTLRGAVVLVIFGYNYRQEVVPKMLQLSLLLTAVCLSLCVAEVFHVTPTLPAAQSCPSPCHTLDQYAQNISLFAGHTNISLVFLKGVHNLSYTLNISGLDLNTNISLLAFQGQGALPGDTVINLLPPASFFLSDFTHLRMLDIHVEALQQVTIDQMFEAFQQVTIDQMFEAFQQVTIDQMFEAFQQVTIDQMFEAFQQVTIDQMFEAFQQVTIDQMFEAFQQVTIDQMFEAFQQVTIDQMFEAFQQVTIDQMFEVFQQVTIDQMCHESQISQINFRQVRFVNHYRIKTKNIIACFVSNTAVNIQDYRVVDGIIFTSSSSTVNIWDCTIDGGAIDSRSVSSLDIQNCRVVDGLIFTLSLHYVNIWNCAVDGGTIVSRLVSSLNIQNCVLHGPANLTTGFFDSYRTALSLRTGVGIGQIQRIMIQNTNVSEYGIGIAFVNNGTINGCSTKNNIMGVASINSNLNIKNTNIIKNRFGLVLAAVDSDFPIGNKVVSINNCVLSGNSKIGLQLMNIQSVSITDCSFYGNHETPIGAYQSAFELRGENVFRDNTAKRGGGLVLFNSTVEFGTGSKTTFVDNKAEEFGGAIYVATLSILSFFADILTAAENVDEDNIRTFLTSNTLLRQDCFFMSHSESITTFIGNSATFGGNDIYGATVYTEDCNLVNFNSGNETLDTYKVSSDPTRVCFCADNSPQCENRTYFMLNETRYPGETFTISVALAGYNFGRVAGSVYTNVLGQDYSGVIDSKSQHIQTLNFKSCDSLNFTLFSKQTSTQVVLALTAQEQITLNQNELDVQTDLRNIYSERCSENYTNIHQCHITRLSSGIRSEQ